MNKMGRGTWNILPAFPIMVFPPPVILAILLILNIVFKK